ncbi:MAG: AI-2E family transporter [Acidobacteria bacterium]|nr:AI-2E family transporter [Acidobacteriota bacterium]
MTIELGPRQRATVAAAITVLSSVIIVAAVGFLLFLLGAFFRSFSNVFLPVAVAGVGALVFKPYYDWLCAVPRMPRVGALVVVFLSMLLPLAAAIWFFGALIIDQLADLVRKLPALMEQASAWAEARWPEVVRFFAEDPWGVRLREAFEEQQPRLLESLRTVSGQALTAGASVVKSFVALAAWAVLPVYFAYFLMADFGRSLSEKDVLPFFKESTRRDVVFLAREFLALVVSFFRGQLVIAFLQGLLFAIGFGVVGLLYGFSLGLILGFLNIVPYLGSILGLGVALPLAYFQDGGGLWLVGAVLGVFVAVQTIEGYVLTPKIMGDRTGLHPMVIMIAIFFWGSALGGVIGMILAIPLTAFLVVLWRLITESYMDEII